MALELPGGTLLPVRVSEAACVRGQALLHGLSRPGKPCLLTGGQGHCQKPARTSLANLKPVEESLDSCSCTAGLPLASHPWKKA